MNIESPEFIRRSDFRQFLTLPYHLGVSSWLDPILKRSSPNDFTRGFEAEFGWFLKKRELRPMENRFWENIGQLLLNAKVFTVTSPVVQLKFVNLVDEYQVTFRNIVSGRVWRSLADALTELASLETRAAIDGVGSASFGWHSMIEFLDRNWTRLEKFASKDIDSASYERRGA